MTKIKLYKPILVTISWIVSIGYLLYFRRITERAGNHSDSLMPLFTFSALAAIVFSLFGFFLVGYLWSEYKEQKNIKEYIEERIKRKEQDILGYENEIKELQKNIKEHKIKIKELKKMILD